MQQCSVSEINILTSEKGHIIASGSVKQNSKKTAPKLNTSKQNTPSGKPAPLLNAPKQNTLSRKPAPLLNTPSDDFPEPEDIPDRTNLSKKKEIKVETKFSIDEWKNKISGEVIPSFMVNFNSNTETYCKIYLLDPISKQFNEIDWNSSKTFKSADVLLALNAPPSSTQLGDTTRNIIADCCSQYPSLRFAYTDCFFWRTSESGRGFYRSRIECEHSLLWIKQVKNMLFPKKILFCGQEARAIGTLLSEQITLPMLFPIKTVLDESNVRRKCTDSTHKDNCIFCKHPSPQSVQQTNSQEMEFEDAVKKAVEEILAPHSDDLTF